jgi:hypothetical protein
MGVILVSDIKGGLRAFERRVLRRGEMKLAKTA